MPIPPSDTIKIFCRKIWNVGECLLFLSWKLIGLLPITYHSINCVTNLKLLCFKFLSLQNCLKNRFLFLSLSPLRTVSRLLLTFIVLVILSIAFRFLIPNLLKPVCLCILKNLTSMKRCFTEARCANRGPHHISSSLISRDFSHIRDYSFISRPIVVPDVSLPLVKDLPWYVRVWRSILKFFHLWN